MAGAMCRGRPGPEPPFAELEGLLQRHQAELCSCLEQWLSRRELEPDDAAGGPATPSPGRWRLKMQLEEHSGLADPECGATLPRQQAPRAADAADECLRALAQVPSPPSSPAALLTPPPARGGQDKLALTAPAFVSWKQGLEPVPQPLHATTALHRARSPVTAGCSPAEARGGGARSRSPEDAAPARWAGRSAALPGTMPDADAPEEEAGQATPRTLAAARGFAVPNLSTGWSPCSLRSASSAAGPGVVLPAGPDMNAAPQTNIRPDVVVDGGSFCVQDSRASGSSSRAGQAREERPGKRPSQQLPSRFSRSFDARDRTRWQQLTRGKKGSSRYRNLTPLAKKRMESMLENQSDLERLTRSPLYEFAEAAAIILNVALIAYDTGHRAHLVSSSPSSLDVMRGEIFFNVLGDLFCVLFTTDLVLRVLADGWEFFLSRERLWNVFDIVVVVTTLLETCARWQQYATASVTDFRVFAGKFAALRIVRLLRIIRSTRAIRASRFIRELSIMVCSLTGAMKPFLWSIVLLNAILLIFSVFFVDGAISFSVQQGDTATGLARFFGTLTTGTTSLFMAMTGGVDWDEIWQALRPMPYEYRVVFLAFISFGILALLNVVTAVFVETAMQRSQNDQDLRVQTEVEKRLDFVQSMQRVFEELDANSSGTLTLEEFERQMEDENVLTFMSTLELDIDQVRTLLTLLDRDQNGEVDIDEFITGCIRLKGGAKSLDMAILQYQVEWMLHNVASLHHNLVGKSATVDFKTALSVSASHAKTLQHTSTAASSGD